MKDKRKKRIDIPVNNLDTEDIVVDDKTDSEAEEDEFMVSPGEFSLLEDGKEKETEPLESEEPLTEGDDDEDIDDVARLTELWQRERASFKNYKRRVEEEKSEIRKYALHDLACGLVTVLDYFDSSITFSENLPEDAENVILGVKYTVEELRRILSAHGISPIVVEVGDKFDSNIMEAVQRKVTSEYDPGTILEVQRRGWQLHDRILRAAQVVVAVPPEENNIEGGVDTE